jgi:hypothetical protein
MKWRVMVELTGSDGIVRSQEVSARRRLLSLFGTLAVRAPRFLPCQCAVARQRTFNPVAEIMPDRCTPEYKHIIAKLGLYDAVCQGWRR